LTKIRKPLICAINGLTIGVGLEIALFCDIIIAADSAKFKMPELALGTTLGNGGSVRIPQATGKSRAMQIFYSCSSFTACQALEWGLVSTVVPKEHLLVNALSLASKIAQNSTVAVSFAKRSIKASFEMGET
jgi:enoyl-CoA hydratase/carnithine racemase